MSNFHLTLQAEADLLEIIDRIADESPDAASRVRDEFYATFIKISANPGMGHYREELLDQRHKFWTVYSYLIVYRWQETPLQVLAIVHGARDLLTFLTRRGLQ